MCPICNTRHWGREPHKFGKKLDFPKKKARRKKK